MRTKYLTAAGLLATSALGVAIVQTGTASASGETCQTSSAGTLCFDLEGAALHVNSVGAAFQASTSMKGYIEIAGPGNQPHAFDFKYATKSYSTNQVQSDGSTVNADVPAGQYCAAFYRLQNNAYSLTNLTCVPVYTP
jgi:hypothetical protein